MLFAITSSPSSTILTTTGVTAILAIALASWSFLMARNPKHWRFWWMARFGMTNLNSDRELRRTQERYLAIGSSVLCLLAFILSLSCTIWTKLSLDEIHAASQTNKASSKSSNLSAKLPPPKILRPGERFVP